MMSRKKEFSIGFVMMIIFVVILVIMFSPVFKGQNGMQYLDSLYNSISKGSAYYIPEAKEKAAKVAGHSVSVKVVMENETQAEQTAGMLMKTGAMVNISGKELKVAGDLGVILAACLEDSDLMYNNNGTEVLARYGFDEKQVLYNWYKSLSAMDKDLQKQENFKDAKVISQVLKKAVECAYNYYTIVPKKISTSLGIVIFSLVFYVVYTMWYGYAIMFMFEGIGLSYDH